jgi:hypothetical protein
MDRIGFHAKLPVRGAAGEVQFESGCRGFPLRPLNQVLWPVFITFVARKGINMSRYCLAVLGVVALLNAVGCVDPVDLSSYNRLVIRAFDAGPQAPKFTEDKYAIQEAIKKHVQEHNPPVFSEIDFVYKNCPKELILTGRAVDYEPIGFPLFHAHAKIEITLTDGATGKVIDKSEAGSLRIGGPLTQAILKKAFVDDLARDIANKVCNGKKKS